MNIRYLVNQFRETGSSLPKATLVIRVGRFVAQIVLGEAINLVFLFEIEGYCGPFPIYSSSALPGPNDCQNEMTAGSGNKY